MKVYYKIIVIITALITIVVVQKHNTRDQEIFVNAYTNADFEIMQSDINVWCSIPNDLLMNNGIEELNKKFASKIGLEEPYDSIDTKRLYSSVITKASEDALTNIRIEKQKDSNEYYTVINILLYDKFKYTEAFKKQIESVLINFGCDPKTNITMVGCHEGEIQEEKREDIVNQVFKYLKASKIEELKTSGIYNVYGYTDLINDYISFANNKVNVDVSIKYNEYEDRTYLYMASPVITIEY